LSVAEPPAAAEDVADFDDAPAAGLVLLLLQAVTPAPSAHARRIRSDL
jgi:hypothetical protein